MKADIDHNSEDSQLRSPWRRTAVRTAIIGGGFSLIVLALLVRNYVGRTVVDAARTEKLDRLKIEILNRPDNEQLTTEIRRLDLQVRRERIRRLDFSRKGGYLLLAGVAVMLIGLKWADTFRKEMPAPARTGDDRQKQVREATWARRAVTIGLAVLGTGALMLMLVSERGFTEGMAGERQIHNWPRFRGPGGLGTSDAVDVPTRWNGKTGEGILWKRKVPLPGHNSPVVWGDRVFLAGADANSRQVYCFDTVSGDLLWQNGVVTAAGSDAEAPDVMEDTGLAAPTAVSDGRRVYAIFANGEVGCFSISGEKVWTRGLGVPESPYGYASSLAMYRNTLLIQYDEATAEDEKSRLIALNAFTGEPVWAMRRPVSASWTSPIVAKVGNQEQIITCGDPWVMAYNPVDGAELWRADCLGADLAPSPICADGFVFAIESNIKLVAIRADGRGDVTKTHIAWNAEDGIPDICSPVSNGELIFLLTSDGTLTCYKVKDGTKLWEKDLGTYFKASPTLVGDRLYVLSEKGEMFIVQVGNRYEELARCELGEYCHASPAFTDGRIYIRGTEHLYCIGGVAAGRP